MQPLGMSLLISHPSRLPLTEQLALFADAGFDTAFVACDVLTDFSRLPALAAHATHCGIAVEAVHAPTDAADALWHDSTAAATALCTLCDHCAAAGIPLLVIHAASSDSVPLSPAGAAQFAWLEQYAAVKGVCLCYENSNAPRHLAQLLAQTAAPHGFCYDSGHHACYTPQEPLLLQYGKKLRYTHLHDNDGAFGGDRHLLPFDGARDWAALAKELTNAGYGGTLNLELACHSCPAYGELPYATFVRIAYERAARLRALMGT